MGGEEGEGRRRVKGGEKGRGGCVSQRALYSAVLNKYLQQCYSKFMVSSHNYGQLPHRQFPLCQFHLVNCHFVNFSLCQFHLVNCHFVNFSLSQFQH